MDHTEAFLLAIREDIDDDTPRLVFADWLQERGDLRGEFIGVQCELARLAEDDPRRPELEIRERELLDAHEAEWLQPFQQWAPRYSRPIWKRGFIEDIHLFDMGEFLTHAPDIFRRMPIRRVAISLGDPYHPSQLTSFAACDQLRLVTELWLSDGPLGNKGAQILAASPHLGRLTELTLCYCQLGAPGALALAGSTRFKNLRRLNLGSDFLEDSAELVNSIGTEGVHSLGWSSHLSQLNALDLSGMRLPIVALRTLAASPLMGRLSELSLRSMGDVSRGLSGLQALARSPQARQLLTLDLSRCWLNAADLRALSASLHLVALQKLKLSEAHFEQDGLEALLARPQLPALTDLSLDHSGDVYAIPEGGLGGAGSDLLFASPLLNHLTCLGLSEQGLGPADMEALSASPRSRQLRRLNLDYNRIGDSGLRALIDSPHLTNLVELRVSSAGISTEGVRSLVSNCGLLSRLRCLVLWGNPIGQTGAELLAASPQVAGLRTLHLDGSRDIGDEGVKALVASPYLHALRQLNLTGSGESIGAEAQRQVQERWGRWAGAS